MKLLHKTYFMILLITAMQPLQSMAENRCKHLDQRMSHTQHCSCCATLLPQYNPAQQTQTADSKSNLKENVQSFRDLLTETIAKEKKDDIKEVLCKLLKDLDHKNLNT